ncbi:hypothetical protein B0H10DRAFT_1946814 [Mycena sp. CBHHK59/15]|nr:hypothetical protein B0H10DRAFT_1946814 [Mycena sp. CBHHK59/15]
MIDTAAICESNNQAETSRGGQELVCVAVVSRKRWFDHSAAVQRQFQLAATENCWCQGDAAPVLHIGQEAQELFNVLARFGWLPHRFHVIQHEETWWTSSKMLNNGFGQILARPQPNMGTNMGCQFHLGRSRVASYEDPMVLISGCNFLVMQNCSGQASFSNPTRS